MTSRNSLLRSVVYCSLLWFGTVFIINLPMNIFSYMKSEITLRPHWSQWFSILVLLIFVFRLNAIPSLIYFCYSSKKMNNFGVLIFGVAMAIVVLVPFLLNALVIGDAYIFDGYFSIIIDPMIFIIMTLAVCIKHKLFARSVSIDIQKR